MKGLSFSSLRVGEKYTLVNYGEEFQFELIEIVSSEEFVLKDVNTMEVYKMSELINLGKGDDLEIRDL
jgi:hypothetical protein